MSDEPIIELLENLDMKRSVWGVGDPKTYAAREAVEKAIATLRADVARLTAERDALQAFKDYVHKRLDDAGVSVDPESPHKAAGCRIGGRLDEVLATKAREKVLREIIQNAPHAHYCADGNYYQLEGPWTPGTECNCWKAAIDEAMKHD